MSRTPGAERNMGSDVCFRGEFSAVMNIRTLACIYLVRSQHS